MAAEFHEIPLLRFSNFTEAWPKARMDSFLVLQRGFDLTKSQSSPGPYPVYSSSGISYYHNEAKVQAPGIVTGRKGSVGPVFFIEEDFWPHDTSLWIKDFKGNIPKFIYHFLVQFGLERYDEASSVPTLNRNNVHRVKVAFPTLPEQRKIADFLTAVDGRIGQLIQKKALLEDYKKGVMQQLFTQAIRFKDDHGNDYPDWEDKKLGEVGEFKNGLNKDKSDFGFGSPFVNLMDVFGKRILNRDEFGLVNATEKELSSYDLKAGDVLFIRSSVKRTGVGEAIVVADDIPGAVYSGFLIRFRSKRSELKSGFMMYCFAASAFRKELLSFATTSANTNINQESLSNIRVEVPCLKEQTKIANFLSALDHKIESVATQITETQTFKRGLLQQMFV